MKDYIPGTHVLWVEYKCHHCGGLPPDFFSETGMVSPVYMPLFNAHSRIRKRLGRPLGVSRGYSCAVHQLHIFLNKVVEKYGRRLDQETLIRVLNDPTMTPFSVHIFGFAFDLTPWGISFQSEPERYLEELARIRKIILETEPQLRIGRSYERHVHIDMGYDIEPRYSESLRQGARW